MGYIVDGQPVDEYGRPIDPYTYQQGGAYMNGNEDDEYDFGFAGYGPR